MKIKTMIAVALSAAVVAASSCSILGLTSKKASTSGSLIGSALAILYQIYKNTGSLNLSDANTVSCLAAVAGNVGVLKDAASDTAGTMLDEFKSGLISGSSNLVNSSNVNSVVSALTSLSNLDLSSLASASKTSSLTAANTADAMSALSSLNSIMKQLK